MYAEELATDELRRPEPADGMTEKLISAMEGILQMSEAQAKSISSIADSVSEIRYALERQKNAITEIMNVRTGDAMASTSIMEEKLSALEARFSNMDESLAAIFERLEGDARMLSVVLQETARQNAEAQEKLNEMLEIARATLAENNAALAEINMKAIERLGEELSGRMNEVFTDISARLARNEDLLGIRIDSALSALNEAMEYRTVSINQKIADMHEAWHNVELENFEETEKLNHILSEMQMKFDNLEQIIKDLKPGLVHRPRPKGAIVDYKAIEEMIANYIKENGRVDIDVLMRHTGMAEEPLRKILHLMLDDKKLIQFRESETNYYSLGVP